MSIGISILAPFFGYVSTTKSFYSLAFCVIDLGEEKVRGSG